MRLTRILNDLTRNKQKNMSKDGTRLEYVANWIADGFTSGYYPYWQLFFNNARHHELSAATLQHIAGLVKDGFVEGSVIDDSKNLESGWWNIQL